MADLVMEVRSVTAKRSGDAVVVRISGELANSRDKAFAETTSSGTTCDIQVRTHASGGFGTQMTGPFSLETKVTNAENIRTVRVHGQNGAKEVSVS